MIDRASRRSGRFGRLVLPLGASLSIAAGFAAHAQAADYTLLAVVKPAMSCGPLAQVDLKIAAPVNRGFYHMANNLQEFTEQLFRPKP